MEDLHLSPGHGQPLKGSCTPYPEDSLESLLQDARRVFLQIARVLEAPAPAAAPGLQAVHSHRLQALVDDVAGSWGLVFLDHRKAGLVVALDLGAGFVMARLPGERGWSAPAALALKGLSAGVSAGYSRVRSLVFLRSETELEALRSGQEQATLGAELQITAGPSAGASSEGQAACLPHCYSVEEGALVELALASTHIVHRRTVNRATYHEDLDPRAILSGAIEAPEEAKRFSAALDEFLERHGATRMM